MLVLFIGISVALFLYYRNDSGTSEIVFKNREIRILGIARVLPAADYVKPAVLLTDMAGNPVPLLSFKDNEFYYFLDINGKYRITVTSPLAESRTVIWSKPWENLDIELVVKPFAAGIVVDSEDMPVSGAKVMVKDKDSKEKYAQTGKNGEFFIGLDSDTLNRLSVFNEGYTEIKDFVLDKDSKALVLRITKTNSLGIRTLDAEGNPVPGCSIVFGGEGIWPPVHLVSGPDGKVAVRGVSEGYYSVSAWNEKLTGDMDGFYVEKNTETEIHLHMDPGTKLKFLVRDRKSGVGIEGASVTVALEDPGIISHTMETDKNGFITTAPLKKGKIRFNITAPGYINLSGRRYWVSDTDKFAVFEMDRGLTLRGQVVDERDLPVENAIVEIHGTDSAGHMVTPVSLGSSELKPSKELGVTAKKTTIGLLTDGAVTTDSEGKFILTGIPSGILGLRVKHQDYSSGFMHLGYVEKTRDDILLKLKKGRDLTGYIVDKAGIPLGGTEIRVESDFAPDFSFTTYADNSGNFKISGCPEVVTLTYRLLGFSPVTETIKPAGDHKVILDRAETYFSIFVRDNRSIPLSGALVTIESTNRPEVFSTISGPSGKTDFKNTGKCPFRVTVNHQEYPEYSFMLEKCEDKNVELPAGGGFELFIRDKRTSNPLSGTLKMYHSSGSEEEFAFSKGKVRRSGVSEGAYTAVIASFGYADVIISLKIPKGNSPGEITLKERIIEMEMGGTVTGNVVDYYGYPVKYARVIAGNETTFTDAVGNFTVKSLESGTVTFHIWHQLKGYAKKDVTVESNSTTSGVNIRMGQIGEKHRKKLTFIKKNGRLYADPIPRDLAEVLTSNDEILSVNGLGATVPLELINRRIAMGGGVIYLTLKVKGRGIESVFY
ncbi:carboxypeptidase-like regulatory domain-containing protein [Myxococcota bacterium]|nr:carboxypeptidase-like regulatory domain-containing protein [Myxococcota bacterium]